MSLTVLEIVKEALGDIGITLPSSIVSTSDKTQIQLRMMIHAQARAMRNLHIWRQQVRAYSFTTEANRAYYPLPEDFYAMRANTGYDQADSIPLQGPAGDSLTQDILYGAQQTGKPYSFRIHGYDFNPTTGSGQFQVIPEPQSAGDELSFEYLTKTTFLPPHWTASEAGVTVNKYRNANGNIYKCTAITSGTTGTTAPSHTSGSAVDNGVTWLYWSAPYEAIVLDTDLSIFDDDIMIEGVKYRYQRSKGLDYEADPETGESITHKRLVSSAIARFYGTFRGTLSQTHAPQSYSVTPRRSWSI